MESNPIQLAYSTGIRKTGALLSVFRGIAADISCRTGQAQSFVQVGREGILCQVCAGASGRSKITRNPALAWEYSVQRYRAESSDICSEKEV